jgi:hypothetical protein
VASIAPARSVLVDFPFAPVVAAVAGERVLAT